jgi:alanyl-tRNA synthetase
MSEPAATERLYYDPSVFTFEASVLRAEARGSGLAVILDRTAFYPDSGGQLADRGVLDGRAVLDVLEEGETVVHILERPETDTGGPGAAPGARVRGEVDRDLRLDHMQQHTGQHILSQAFVATSGRDTLSFHMGDTTSSIEVAGALTPAMIEAAEDLANRIFFEDRPVHVLSLTREEAAARGVRKLPERAGILRVIEVEGFDLSPCCGTHVPRAGVIGLVKILSTEKLRANTRVEFVCGRRALVDYRFRNDILRALAATFTTGEAGVAAAVARLRDESKAARKALEEARRELTAYRAREMEAAFEPFGPVRLLRKVVPDSDASSLQVVARAVTAAPDRVVLLASPETGSLLFARSREGGPALLALDMGAILRETVAGVGGKGGGRPDLAQGGVQDPAQAERALEAAGVLLRGRLPA